MIFHCACACVRAVAATELKLLCSSRSRSHSKGWVCGRSLAGIVSSNPAGARKPVSVSVVCC